MDRGNGMSDYTPGPWFRVESHDETAWTDSLAVGHMAHPNMEPSDICHLTRGWDEGVAEANAALIAAAPCLLTALQGLLPHTFTGSVDRKREIEHWESERDLGNGEAPFVLAAWAAIAKATGADHG